MQRHMVFALFALAGLASVLACGDSGRFLSPEPEGIVVVRDGSFPAKRDLTPVDFENLPANGSSCPNEPFEVAIDNPLTLEGVVFSDPDCLRAGYCSSPTCPTANILLALNQGATVTLPPNRGVLVEIEGMGGVPLVLEVEDGGGRTVAVEETGTLNGTVVLGFRSGPGIAKLRVVRVGPTPPDCPEAPCGPLGLSRLSFTPR